MTWGLICWLESCSGKQRSWGEAGVAPTFGGREAAAGV